MYDYHTHSEFSFDGCDSIGLLGGAAIGTGLTELAVTDHYDPDYNDPDTDGSIDYAAYTAALTKAASFYNVQGSPLRFVKGIEIGIQSGSTANKCSEAVSGYDFDYVIGSVHSACGWPVDLRQYLAERSVVTAARDYYTYALECLDAFDDFDVFGHLNVIDRYMDSYPAEDDVWDLVDRVIVKLVDMGKGMEVNTSAWRIWPDGSHTTPTLRMLRRYAELGGETVTTGSDAHSARRVGAFLKEGEELIRSAGLRYLATFKDRKPVYIKL